MNQNQHKNHKEMTDFILGQLDTMPDQPVTRRSSEKDCHEIILPQQRKS